MRFMHLRCIHFSTSVFVFLVLIIWVLSNLKTQLNVIHYSSVVYWTQMWHKHMHTHTQRHYSQEVAHGSNKGIKVSLDTIWRCLTLRPKTPTTLHNTHTFHHYPLQVQTCPFCCWAATTKQMLSINSRLKIMICFSWSHLSVAFAL